MAHQHPHPDLSNLSHSAKVALIVALRASVEELRARVKELKSTQAKVTVRKDSHNSSIPSSADGLAKKKTRSLRKPSSNKAGGQPGHTGTTLKQAAQPTRTVVHPLPTQCSHCRMPLPADGARVSARRQVIDIPVMPSEIIEHQIMEQVCRCGCVHVSTFPSTVTEAVQYGPNVKALAVHLTHGQLLPYARTAQLLDDLYGI